MYEDAKDDDDLEQIVEDAIAEEAGEQEELDSLKKEISSIDNNIKMKQEKLGTTQRNIQLLTRTIKVETTQQPEELKEQETNDEDNSDDEELAQYFENQNDSEDEEETQEVIDPKEETLIKLKDKISLLRYRIEAGLGTTLSEKAYKLIKTH